MSATSIVQRLAGHRLVRQIADAGLGWYARPRTAWLDTISAARAQCDGLLWLVRRARFTRFGRDHDFAHIQSIRDYQKRVPLRDYEAFWRDYWQPAFPRLVDVAWPGAIPYLALSSGTTTGSTKYIPVSREMIASNRRAALTTLALYLAAHRSTPLFVGKAFLLGGCTDLTRLADGVLAGDLSGIAACEVPAVLRPYTFPPLELALLRDWDQKMNRLADQSLHEPITMVGGVPSWLLVLFERVLQIAGEDCIADAWPMLRVVIHGGTKFDPYRERFRRVIGSDHVHFLETYPASEAFIATEDPRYGMLRLIPDHGVFFEFVPVQELEAATPARHTLANLECGVHYAVVLTTCAGLWSYVLGDTVCFEKRDPPLLRFTGRTRYFLSAFGEHLISEEVERAIATAAQATKAEVVDFHVGPVFAEDSGVAGRHRYLIEFAQPPRDLGLFGTELDAFLSGLNEDYAAHRQRDLTLRAPEICPVRRGGFADWMRAHGKLGGQHKVPRMDNSGQLGAELSRWFEEHPVQAV